MRTASVLVVVREHVRLIFVLFFEKEPFAGTHTHLKWSLSFGFFFLLRSIETAGRKTHANTLLSSLGLKETSFIHAKQVRNRNSTILVQCAPWQMTSTLTTLSRTSASVASVGRASSSLGTFVATVRPPLPLTRLLFSPVDDDKCDVPVNGKDVAVAQGAAGERADTGGLPCGRRAGQGARQQQQ